MLSKKPFLLVLALGLLLGGKALLAEEETPVTLPAAAVSVSQGGQFATTTAFRVVQEKNATFVTIMADLPFTFTSYNLDSPLRYVIDLPGLTIPSDLVKSVEVNSRAVRIVRFSNPEQPSEPARLEMELNRPASCKTFANTNRTGLLIRVDEAQEPLTVAATETTSGPSLSPAVATLAQLPEAEPSAALAPAAYSDFSSPSPGESPGAVSVVPDIPTPNEGAVSSAAETSLGFAANVLSAPTTAAEGAAAASVAPAIPNPEEVPVTGLSSLNPSTSPVTPSGTEVVEVPAAVSTAPNLPEPTGAPTSSGQVSLAANASAVPITAMPLESPAPETAYVTPPPLLAMSPSLPPTGAVVKVALAEEPQKSASFSADAPSGTVSVDFVNTPLADVFKSLAFQSGKGILVSDDVKGNATVQFNDMPLESAVDLIASMYGLTVKRVENVYLITKGTGAVAGAATRQTQLYYLKAISAPTALSVLGLIPEVKAIAVEEKKAIILAGSESDLKMAIALLNQVDRGEISPEGVMTRLISLQNADPDGVAQYLRNAVPGITILVESQLKAITIKGTPADVNTAEQMVQELDKGVGGGVPAVATTAIKVQFVAVSALAAKLQGLLPALKVTYDEALKALFLSGTHSDIEAAKTVIAAIDVAPAAAGAAGEAGTEVIIRNLEYTTPDEAKAFLEAASPSKAISVETSKDSNRIVITAPRGMYATLKQMIDTIDVPPREVVIEAMITDMSRSLSSNLGFAWDFGGTIGFQMIAPANATGIGFPSVGRGAYTITNVLTAIEGDTNSKLLARPSIRVIDSKEASILIGERLLFQVATIQAGAVVYAIREERVGIALTVKPRITSDGHVLLTLHPEVSTVTGFNPQGYPNIATREADTIVRLADGQTLVIGGLIQEEDIASVSKVPILSEIPILGDLFKRRAKTSSPSEVLIFVTPHIINKGEEL
jgi:general secretion pathway protein D